MTSFNDGVPLAKEAASIDQQKKQFFRRTGLDTVVEAINDMFSIKLKDLQHIHRNHSQATEI